jgi:NTE family protein
LGPWLRRRRGKRGVILALGGGGARGLAHAGALAALDDHGIPVRGIVGTSIGAEIGGLYAGGLSAAHIQELVRGFDWLRTVRLFWPSLDGGGLTSGHNIESFLRDQLGDLRFADLALPFRAVATDMAGGEQVVLSEGTVVDAIRASIALPGIIRPHRMDGRTLGDGGLVNPLPADLAAAELGKPVIAVGVHPGATQREDTDQAIFGDVADQEAPPVTETLRRAIQITQAQIVDLRLASHPPDLLLTPRVADIGVLEFYEGEKAMRAGYESVTSALDRIRKLAG